jgi:hypothetical protein
MPGLFSRKRQWAVAGLLFLLVLSGTAGLAQDNTSPTLIPDEPVESFIDAQNAARVYTFAASIGDRVSVGVNSDDGLTLSILLTNAQGENIGQAIGSAEQTEVLLADVDIPETGTYYVMIFPSAGGDTTTGTFTLALSQSDATGEPVTAPPDDVSFQLDTVVLTGGLEINLVWNTRDDLNLQVRDPIGETLFWGSRSTSNGGTFGPDINGLCEILVDPPAVETASWPGGAFLSSGSYEILVYYRQACEGNEPVDFAVNVVVDGESLDPIEGTIDPPVDGVSNVFISSVYLETDGTASTGLGGPYLDTRVLDLPAQDLLDLEATPIVLDEIKAGVITRERPYETFTFDGQSGDIIAIRMTATSGSLDTLLLVMDSQGLVIAGNDDIEPAVNTNSAIDGLRLPVTGTYTVVATRYGKLVGGTEGEYELIVSASDVPLSLLELDLPAGDIEITLTWDTNADVRLLVRDPAGDSVYNDVTAIPSGGRMTEFGNINCFVSEGPPISYVYWPNDLLRVGPYEIDIWFRSECNDTRPMTFEVYVVVEGELVVHDVVSNLTFNQHYLTSFSIDGTGQTTRGQGGFLGGSEMMDYQPEMASAIRINSGQTAPGSINNNNRFDLYVFDGQAGDVVTIDMVATSQNLDTLLYLLDTNGVEIASNDDATPDTTDARIANIVLPQDGEYTIIATRFGGMVGGTIGTYNLTLRID